MKRLVMGLLVVWLGGECVGLHSTTSRALAFTEPEIIVPAPAPLPAVAPTPGSEAWLAHPPAPPDDPPPTPPSRWWFQADYLYWFLANGPISAPIVTSRPNSTEVFPTVLIGDRSLGLKAANGMSLHGGWWADCEHTLGIEIGGFMTEVQTQLRTIGSDTSGNPDLDRPLVNLGTGQIIPIPISISNSQMVGRIDVQATSQLAGGEAQAVLNLYHNDWLRLDVLPGLLYLDLTEDLKINQTSSGLAFAQFQTGAFGLLTNQPTFQVQDRFATHDQFLGASIGGRAEGHVGALFLRVMGKVAVGDTYQEIQTLGSTTYLPGPPQQGASGALATVTVGPVGQTIPAGVLVTQENAGHFTRDRLTFGSEVETTVGVDVTCWFRIFLGFDFLYWSAVARPGAQVSNQVNLSEVPLSILYVPNQGPSHPIIPFIGSDFWVLGMHVGLEVDF